LKVKVISKDSEDYNKEFKVRRMNYEQTVVNYPNSEGIEIFLNKDIEFITETELDQFLINNKDFLKIKLNRGISIFLYKVLLESIEEQLKDSVKSLNLLIDKYSVNKRGIWNKEIICVINNVTPIKIIASGQNFKKMGYSINLEEINSEDFLELCKFETIKIRKSIKNKELELSRYKEAVECIKPGVKADNIFI